MARRLFRNRAVRVLDWLSSGRRGSKVHLAVLGMARHVLDRRRARPAGLLHPSAGARIRGVETTPHAWIWCDREDCYRALEDLLISDRAHDANDVFVARHTGSLSRFSEDISRSQPFVGFIHRHSVQHRRCAWRNRLRPSLRTHRAASGLYCGARACAGDDPPLGIQ